MDELTNDILAAALAKAGRLDLDLCAHILSMALWKQSGRPTTVRRATNSGGLKAVPPATGAAPVVVPMKMARSVSSEPFDAGVHPACA
jgi:hypothetical protein